MTLLHVYFHLRRQQAFQRLLDGSLNRGQSSSAQASSSSGGKSWKRHGPLASVSQQPDFNVNARDSQGRTVLHLAASSSEPSATEYIRLLLTHPDIDVNLKDKESHWTALHRALYHGNIESAVLLLQRPEINTSLKDLEGYTAFDLYNSTLEGTKPEDKDLWRADLFTWGTNRNAALGHGSADDRTFAEPVVVQPVERIPTEKEHIDAQLNPIHVRQVVMSKLHTGAPVSICFFPARPSHCPVAVVTDENKGNLRICGFGSGGRYVLANILGYYPIYRVFSAWDLVNTRNTVSYPSSSSLKP